MTENTLPEPTTWDKIARTPLSEFFREECTGRLNVKRRALMAGLPVEAVVFIGKIVRRTRLLRYERLDIADELIAHFQDGRAHGATVESIIEAFGDPALGARLIRRAKKRLRPWPWRAFVRSFQGTAAIIGVAVAGALIAYAVLTVRFYWGAPNPTHDYLADLNVDARAVPEEDRAWPVYREALLMMEELPKKPEGYARYPRPGEPGWEEIEAWLARNEEAIALVHKAAAMPGVGFVLSYDVDPEDQSLWPDEASPEARESDERLLFELWPRHSRFFLKMRATLNLHARSMAAAGDSEAFRRDATTLICMAHHMREAPLLIDDLVSLYFLSGLADMTLELMDGDASFLSEDDLTDLVHEFSIWGNHPSDRIRFQSARAQLADFAQHVYTDDGRGDGRVTNEGIVLLERSKFGYYVQRGNRGVMLNSLLRPAASAFDPTRAEYLDLGNYFIDQFEIEAGTDRWRRGESVENELWEYVDSGFRRELEQISPADLVPDFGRTISSVERLFVVRDAAMVAMTLEIYRRRNGQFPDRLSDLVPHLLPELPLDRFDGQPLRYLVKNGRPIVYSVGNNRKDDGGKPPTGKMDTYNVSRWEARKPEGHEIEADWILFPPRVPPLLDK